MTSFWYEAIKCTCVLLYLYWQLQQLKNFNFNPKCCLVVYFDFWNLFILKLKTFYLFPNQLAVKISTKNRLIFSDPEWKSVASKTSPRSRPTRLARREADAVADCKTNERTERRKKKMFSHHQSLFFAFFVSIWVLTTTS